MRVQQEVTGRGWPYTVIRRAKSDLCIRVGSARLRRPSVSLSIIYIYAISNTNILPQILGSLPSGCRRIRFELSPTTTTTAHTKVFKSGTVGGTTTVGRIWSLRPRSALRGRRLQVRREERAPPRAKAAPCPRPRGRSPPGCTWDEQQGGWWKANGSEWQSPDFPKPKDPKPLKARPIGQRLSRRSLRHGVRARRRYASTAPPSTAPSTSTRSMTRCAASVPRRAGVTPGALHITPADEPHTDQHSRVPQVVFFENGSFTRTQIAVRRWRESRKSELTSIYIKSESERMQ